MTRRAMTRCERGGDDGGDDGVGNVSERPLSRVLRTVALARSGVPADCLGTVPSDTVSGRARPRRRAWGWRTPEPLGYLGSMVNPKGPSCAPVPAASARFVWSDGNSSLRTLRQKWVSADGIIVGASSMRHLEQNLKACDLGAADAPLPAAVVDAFDAAWDRCRPACPKYFRP